MIFLSIGIFFLIVLLFVCWKINKSIVDPLVLHSISWLLVFSVGIFYHSDFFELTLFFWSSWFLWFFSFLLGYIFIFSFSKNNNSIVDFEYKPLPNFSFVIYIINLFFLILTVQEGLNGGYGNFLFNLRMAYVNKEYSTLGLFFFLFTFFWPIFLYEGVVFKNKSNFVSLLVFLLIYTLASGGKFGILMIFSSLLLILNLRNVLKIKHILWVFVIFIILFGLIGFLRGQTESDLTAYLYSPLVAFEEIKNSKNLFFGHETLRFFYSFFYTLKITNVPPPDDFYNFIMTPVYTNVYTAMRPFYLDFGYFGIFLGGFFYGLLFSYFYLGYCKKKILPTVIYLGFAFALVTIPFSDLLFLNFSLLFRTLLISFFLLLLFDNKVRLI